MPDFSTVWFEFGGEAVGSAAGLSLMYWSTRMGLEVQMLLQIILACN
jgi:hypothetical protein